MLKVMSKPGGCTRSRDKPGGDLLTGQAVSGVKVARARFRLLRRNRGTRALDMRPRDARGERERTKPLKPRGAEYRARARGRTVP